MIYTPQELKQMEERDRKANYWRGFKTAIFIVIIIIVVIVNIYVITNI